MWKLSEVRIENIVSFHTASLKVKQGVATLIFGKNEDNASQPCNGSGKSSLVEAISFALTGEQLRKVKTIDEIINDQTDTASVYMVLENDYDGSKFTIERTISRRSAQVIECHKYDSSGVEIEQDKTIQPTVSDYNKFILDEIGLSKDDIYSNFILCDNKFESFFDCSDKGKKEIINRFSNGVLIDDSIEKLRTDMLPLEQKMSVANTQLASVRGSISAIENELDSIDQKVTESKIERANRIRILEDKIVKCRADISKGEEQIVKAKDRQRVCAHAKEYIEGVENSDASLISAYTSISTLCEQENLGSISDYKAIADQHQRMVELSHHRINDINQNIELTTNQLDEIKSKLSSRTYEYESHISDFNTKSENARKDKKCLNAEIQEIEDSLDKIESTIRENKKIQTTISVNISQLETLMNGAVECPKCQHKFSPQSDEDLESIKSKLQDATVELSNMQDVLKQLNDDFDKLDEAAEQKSKQIFAIDNELKQDSQAIEEENTLLNRIKYNLTQTESKIAEYQRQLTEENNEISKANGKLAMLRDKMFGEFYTIIESRMQRAKSYIEQQESFIEFTKGQMTQYQQSKRELVSEPDIDLSSSLKKSLAKYEEEFKQKNEEWSELKGQYDVLKGQEEHFVMFKSYIARKKIDALSVIVNDFLEKIGSDIRLKLEGFTITKTGKLRDKISVQVMRDGVDCGSYYKFSGGEKARLNLACILSLHTLVNSNCEDGKGLDFIIIDELLDKSDEVGIATYCDALNKLGQTSLLITQGSVSEGYPHRLLITKRQGVSVISEQ